MLLICVTYFPVLFLLILVSNDEKLFFLSRCCAGFRTLGAIFGATLHAVFNAGSVECSSDDVITDARKILNPTASYQDDRVLLQVMTDTGNVCSDFHTVGQADTSDLPKSRVRLFGSSRLHLRADAATLRA